MTKSSKTFVTLILDETGSMETIRDDTIGGYNAYIDTLKDEAKKNGTDFSFSLVKFDSRAITTVHVGEDIENVPHLTRATYVPGAATPLIDACVKGIHATAQVAKKGCPVVFVIQTDGYENASIEYTFKELAKLVREKEKDGWHFVFLGAGIDAYETAQVIGIGPRSTASYDLRESDEAFASTARNTVNVARSGGRRGSSDYSASQKRSMGDAFDPDGEKRKSRKRNGFSLTSR